MHGSMQESTGQRIFGINVRPRYKHSYTLQCNIFHLRLE